MNWRKSLTTGHGRANRRMLSTFLAAVIGLSGWPAAPRRASTGRLLAFVVLPNLIPVIFIEVLTKCQYQLKLKFALPE
jgi:hypothetical protein